MDNKEELNEEDGKEREYMMQKEVCARLSSIVPKIRPSTVLTSNTPPEIFFVMEMK